MNIIDVEGVPDDDEPHFTPEEIRETALEATRRRLARARDRAETARAESEKGRRGRQPWLEGDSGHV